MPAHSKDPKAGSPPTPSLRLEYESPTIRRHLDLVAWLELSRQQRRRERVEQVLPFVVKKDGRREPFDRIKLLAGVRRACEKRPVSQESLELLLDQIERDLVETGEKEVVSTIVGEKVMAALRALDAVAYVRFASVYRSFDDVSEFAAEIGKLLPAPPETTG